MMLEETLRGGDPHLFVLLDLALLKHGEDIGGASVSGCLPPLGLLGCLRRKPGVEPPGRAPFVGSPSLKHLPSPPSD